MHILFLNPKWRKHENIWFSGDLDYETATELTRIKAANIIPFCKDRSINHFALVFHQFDSALCITDQIASFPIIYNHNEQLIGDTISCFPNHEKSMDPIQEIVFKNSGYTLGENTIYKGWKWIPPFSRYTIYSKNIHKKHYNPIRVKKTNISDSLYSEMLENYFLRSNKSYILPLSAGKDSRSILWALHKKDKDYNLVTYGSSRNWDSEGAAKISKFLNKPLLKLHKTFLQHRQIWKSNEIQEFLRITNTGVAIPYYQDYAYLNDILHSFSGHHTFTNGNTGDFLSGKHIDKNCANFSDHDMVKFLLVKYFNLWKELPTQEKEIILIEIDKEIVRLRKKYKIVSNLALQYFFEWENRQAKYLMSGQRAYDLYQIEWELPFWSLPLVNEHLLLEVQSLVGGIVYDKDMEKSGKVLFDDVTLRIQRYDLPINYKILRKIYKLMLHWLIFIKLRENNIWQPLKSVLKICACRSYFRNIFMKPYNVETAALTDFYLEFTRKWK